jgi:hypothetical protein
MYYLFIVYYLLFGCICYLNCINAATGWTTHLQFSDNNKKVKSIPVTGRGDLYCYGILRIPHYLYSRLTDGGEVLNLTRRPRFISQNIISVSDNNLY